MTIRATARYITVIKRLCFHFSGASIVIIGAQAIIVVDAMVNILDVAVAVILGEKQRERGYAAV
jgi:hypothetical protein